MPEKIGQRRKPVVRSFVTIFFAVWPLNAKFFLRSLLAKTKNSKVPFGKLSLLFLLLIREVFFKLNLERHWLKVEN